MFSLKNRLRATSQLLPPRTRVARTLQQKTSFLLPGPRPIGRGRYAERPHLSCVRSFHFPPLPSPTCFWRLHNTLFTDFIACRSISLPSAVSQREPSASVKFMLLPCNSIVPLLVPSFHCMSLNKGKSLPLVRPLPTKSRSHPPALWSGNLLIDNDLIQYFQPY